MNRVEVPVRSLIYLDAPLDDERTAAIEAMPVEERPPIIVINRPYEVGDILGPSKVVIIDGSRRAWVHPHSTISALKIGQNNADVEEARRFIKNPYHFLLEDMDIKTVADLRAAVSVRIRDILCIRPLEYKPKYPFTKKKR